MNISFSTHFLENGLKILIHEDPAVSKAAVNIVYRVGARDEHADRTGFAHLFEHLMFGGSRHIPDYDRHVQRIGGECNAFTNNDLTNYYLTCPANQLETAFWLESDRMLELDFSQRRLDVQKSVVSEEFKQRYLNQPYGDAYLVLRDLHYTAHPYRWMTIGKELRHIEEATLDDVQAFFYNFYAPNNATMVVAGHVKTDEVLALAEKWFGPIPNRPVNRPERPTEPPQTAERRKTVHRPVPHAAVYHAYHIPARTDEAYYAADMLTDLLANGQGARLYQRLVKETQVASRATSFSWGLLDPGILSFEARMADGRSPEEYEAELDKLLDGFADSVTEAELTRMKNKVEAYDVFQKTSVINRAISMAEYDYVGDPNLINTVFDHYQRLTVADVQAAIRQWLRPENRSILHYLPEA